MQQIAKPRKHNMPLPADQLCDMLADLFDRVRPQIGSAPVFSAVSGGADSLSLAHSAQHFADKNGLAHIALVVNHNIRSEAEAEALSVIAELARHQITAELLTINVPPPQGDIQNWARNQRFAKLTERARESGGVLLLGHHCDDQAETILMRLHKGSSLSGLKAMMPVSYHDGVACLRPFLGITKSALIRYCGQHDIRYVTDRSNFDTKFERVRMRQFLTKEPHLCAEAISMGALCGQIDAMVQAQLHGWLAHHMLACSPVEIRVARHPFEALPPHAQIYLLRCMMQFVGASPYPASFSAVETAQKRIMSGHATTLSGCYGYRTEKALIFQPEWGRKSAGEKLAIMPDVAVIFDDRWVIYSPYAGQIMRYGTLKRAYPEAVLAIAPHLTHYGSRSRDMIPCFLGLDGQIKAPHFSMDRDLLYSTEHRQISAITVWPKHIPELLDGFFRYDHLTQHHQDVLCS